MRSFAKRSKTGSRNAIQNASKKSRPFFDQNHAADPFFKKQPEVQRDSAMTAGKRLRRLDFGESTRPPSGARLRVPSSGEIQGMLSSGKVDEAVVLSRVRKLLERMYRERKLRGAVNIDITMHEIFPIPGVLDQAAFERYIDPTDRKMVYNSVQDAFTTPHSAQQPDLKKGFAAAANMAEKVSGDSKGLKRVFGSKSDEAKSNYKKIKEKLNDLTANIGSKSITTDYNGDTEESHVGGWARFSDQHLHLREMAVSDPSLSLSKRTFIHEAAHLANENIGDNGGYMGSAGFMSAEEETKLNNAAHYEVLPCVRWDKSCTYKKGVFKPASVNSPSAEEQVKAGAKEYCTLSWDAAADFFWLIKEVYTKQSVYDKDELMQKMMERPLLTVSRLMDLTLHEQNYPPVITLLDVVTAESVARIVGFAGEKVVAPAKAPAPGSPDFKTSVKKVAEKALVDVGGILGDPNRDRILLTWLHDHYHRIETSF